jgi:para-nitrobenzyl esterase
VPPTARQNRFAASHGETVAYAFGTIGREDDSQPVEDSEQGREISEAMMEYWVTFMREGELSGKKLPDWPRHDLSSLKAMVFGNQGIAAS